MPRAAAAPGSTASRSTPATRERRTHAGRLELVALESARPGTGRRCGRRPRRRRPPRARVRLDRLLALPARGGPDRRDGDAVALARVDVAAAQLIVRESGGLVAFTAATRSRSGRRSISARSHLAASMRRALSEALAGSHCHHHGVIDWNLVARIAETDRAAGRHAAPAGRRSRPRSRATPKRASSPTPPSRRAPRCRRPEIVSRRSGSMRTCARCAPCSTLGAPRRRWHGLLGQPRAARHGRHALGAGRRR